MPSIRLRKATALDFDAIVALNAVEVRHTSPMDARRLRELDALACYHKVATLDGKVAAFLFAMKNGCGYANQNFTWFADRYPSFLYIDRIVVTTTCQRQGLGSRLYHDLLDHARARGISIVACEYNILPPNQSSASFHHGFGFIEVGRQWLEHGSKQVSMQIAKVVP